MQPYYAPDFQVKIEGLTIEADVSRAITDLTYDNNIETADMFRLQIDNSGLRFTDSPLFDVGKTVEIYMGYAGGLQPMMLGEITAVSPSFPSSGAPTISVTGYDKSHRMRNNAPEGRTFTYLNDSMIAAQIAAENLLIPMVDPAPMPPKQVTQSDSDWALLNELAERNFFHLYVFWDRLYFGFPRPQIRRVALEWGKNLISFSPRLSISGMAGIQVVRGFDTELAQAVVAVIPLVSLDTDLDVIIERLGSDFIQRLAQMGRRLARGYRPTNYFDAMIMAKSLLKWLLEGLYEGNGSCIGLPELRAGSQIEILGIGKRFSGSYRLHRVTHTINGNGYLTSFEVSQRHNLSLLASLRDKIDTSPSPRRQEPVTGVVIGEVTDNKDPLGRGRVKLKFPDASDFNQSDWVIVAPPGAGSGQRGISFLPEIKDKVLVAFERGDCSKPYVIGSIYTGLDQPPEGYDAANKMVIRTRSGAQILFDETEEKQNIKIVHPAGGTMTLDENGTITVKAKNLTLEATESISLKANNVAVEVANALDVTKKAE
jgi:phage protein D/phage baseplate assembly protein gpV